VSGVDTQQNIFFVECHLSNTRQTFILSSVFTWDSTKYICFFFFLQTLFGVLLLWAFVFRRSSKLDLTMFFKCNIWTGTFGLGLKPYTMWKAWSWRRLMLLRSYAKGSFGSMAEKGTDLKGKRLSSPRWVVHKPIVNMKGMNVNLHRLRPVPINWWTPHTVDADLYSFVCHTWTFTFCQAEVTNCNTSGVTMARAHLGTKDCDHMW
jgi:hypothetical protein